MAYRDDIEALEAEAEDLRRKLAATDAQIAHAERMRLARQRDAPKGPAFWLSCLMVVLLVPLALVLASLIRFSMMRG